MKLCSLRTIRPVLISLLILSLGSCKGAVFHFSVIDDASNKPLPQSEITVQMKSDTKTVQTGDSGEASLSVKDDELPETYFLRYEVKKQGYAVYKGGADLLPRQRSYRIPAVHMAAEGAAKKRTGLHFALTEDSEGMLSAEVRNNGEKPLSRLKVKIILYGLREDGEGVIREEIIGEMKKIGPDETQKIRYDARQDMDRLIKAEARIECSECGELEQAKLVQTLYPVWAGIKPDLSMGLADDKDGTVMVQLKNKGRMAVTGVRLKITACCSRQTGNREEILSDLISGSIRPTEMFIKVYNLKDLIKGLDLSEIVRVAYSVSCEECLGITKGNVFSEPVEMMFIRGGDLPFSPLPYEVDEIKKQ